MANKLWIPGESLGYLPYTREHLVDDWVEFYANGGNVSFLDIGDDILGILQKPERPPTKIASVDLCEVVRETHLATIRAIGKDREHLGVDRWDYRPSFTFSENPTLIGDIVRVVMNEENLVEPIENIGSIRETLISWREAGVYVFANTSTLTNCEQATIKYLLARELPNCFDGIIFPRNHFGDSEVTKGTALELVASKVGIPVEKALHIDDAPYHHRAVAQHIGGIASNAMLIMPTFGDINIAEHLNGVTHPVVTANGPHDAFAIADEFLMTTI